MRWILLSLMALSCACWGEDEEPPGELIGSFQALGLMVEQSCGSAVPAPDPLDLKFDLRSESNGRAYWRLWGGALFAGIENDGTYTFQTSQSWMVVEPDRFRGYVGCSVTQRDVFTFEVSVSEIGEKYSASAHHLAKVMHTLGRAGLVRASRGVGGGYSFSGNARRTTLLDVIQLFENVSPGHDELDAQSVATHMPYRTVSRSSNMFWHPHNYRTLKG